MKSRSIYSMIVTSMYKSSSYRYRLLIILGIVLCIRYVSSFAKERAFNPPKPTKSPSSSKSSSSSSSLSKLKDRLTVKDDNDNENYDDENEDDITKSSSSKSKITMPSTKKSTTSPR